MDIEPPHGVHGVLLDSELDEAEKDLNALLGSEGGLDQLLADAVITDLHLPAMDDKEPADFLAGAQAPDLLAGTQTPPLTLTSTAPTGDELVDMRRSSLKVPMAAAAAAPAPAPAPAAASKAAASASGRVGKKAPVVDLNPSAVRAAWTKRWLMNEELLAILHDGARYGLAPDPVTNHRTRHRAKCLSQRDRASVTPTTCTCTPGGNLIQRSASTGRPSRGGGRGVNP